MVEVKKELKTEQVMHLVANERAFWNLCYAQPLETIIPEALLRGRLVKHEINQRLPEIGDAYAHPVRVGMILLTKLLPNPVSALLISRSPVIYTIALATMGAEMIYLQRQSQTDFGGVPWDGHILSRILSVYGSMAKDHMAEVELLLKPMPLDDTLKTYVRRYNSTSALTQAPRTYH